MIKEIKLPQSSFDIQNHSETWSSYVNKYFCGGLQLILDISLLAYINHFLRPGPVVSAHFLMRLSLVEFFSKADFANWVENNWNKGCHLRTAANIDWSISILKFQIDPNNDTYCLSIKYQPHWAMMLITPEC